MTDTNTPEGNGKASPVRKLIVNPFPDSRYHPARIQTAWFRFAEHCENEDREFDGYISEVLEMMQHWAEGRHLNELDEILIGNVGEDTEGYLDTVLNDPSKWGFVIDASGLADLESNAFIDDDFPDFPKDMKRAALYVHLGENAFPSPYDDVGVEGVYLEIDRTSVDKSDPRRPFNIFATAVCSQPDYPDVNGWGCNYGDRSTCISPALYMRDQLRHSMTAFYSSGKDGLDKQIAFAETRVSDPDVLAWARFLSRPVRAALNAAHLAFGSTVPAYDAMPGMAKKDVEAVADRHTDANFFRMAPHLDDDRLCVRFLGEMPRQRPKRELEVSPFEVRAGNAHEVAIAIDDSFDQTTGDDAAVIMRSARSAAWHRRNETEEDRVSWIRACAASLQAELHASELEEAEIAAQGLAQLAETDPTAEAYLPLVWLTFELCDRPEQAALVESRLDPLVWEDLIQAVRSVRERLGEGGDVGNFMENGAHLPFMMQFIESMQPGSKASPRYSSEWHYGNAQMHDVQVWRANQLAGRSP